VQKANIGPDADDGLAVNFQQQAVSTTGAERN
jgi:hypothetical protein